MKLYVGNLPFTTADEDLQQLFAQHGTLASAKVMTDRETGRSRGFGFVEFENDDEAKAAIEALNNSDFEGRTLVVNEARPRGERTTRREFSNSGGGNGSGSFRQRY